MDELAGKVAVVTGAGRGQGRAHAVALAQHGAAVIAIDACEDVDSVPYSLARPAELEQTKRLVAEAGGECVTIRADVRNSSQMNEAMREALFEYGHIDICIASAGVVSFGSVESLSDQQWRVVLDTNLTGTFNTVRAVVPPMVKAGYGRIVTVASMGGRGGAPHLGHYAASKWGVIGLTKSIALELAGTGVTANVLCPTTVSTHMVHNSAMYSLFAPDLVDPSQDQVLSRYASLNPMRVPWIDVSDVTGAMLYLISDNARYVSGTTVEIGAGVSARLP